MNRLPIDVAQEVAAILKRSGIGKPHLETLNYATCHVRLELMKDTVSWLDYMMGTRWA